MSTTIERIAGWASGLELEAVPEAVIERSKLQLLSMVAAVYSGYPTRAARAVREVALMSRARGRSTVLPMGDRTSVTMAVMANAAASMALDYDDYLFMGHPGHCSVLASLALAEEMGLGGRELLRAQIAANEAAGRLGASVALGPQNGQLWTHIHALGAALAGALLLDLDTAASAHAMALAMYQPPLAMWPGFMGPDSKLLSAAYPARDGLYAARLASWGLRGPLDILDDRRGFGGHFADQFLPAMLSGWGQSWVSHSLSFKIYPGCAYLDAALDALFDVRAQFAADNGRPLEPADVVSVEVDTGLLGSEMQRLTDERASERISPVRVNFSFPLSLAVALRAGRLTPAELDEEALAAAADTLRSLAKRIRVRHDWRLTLKLIDALAAELPLRQVLAGVDLRRLLAPGRGGLQPAGLLADLQPRDLLRLTALLWQRAPELMRQAGRAAAGGLGRLMGGGDQAALDLGRVRFERLVLPFSARVTLRVRGDRSYRAEVELARGAAGHDFAEVKGLVRKKFRDLAAPLLGQDKADRAIALVDGLERLDDIGELTAALRRDDD